MDPKTKVRGVSITCHHNTTATSMVFMEEVSDHEIPVFESLTMLQLRSSNKFENGHIEKSSEIRMCAIQAYTLSSFRG